MPRALIDNVKQGARCRLLEICYVHNFYILRRRDFLGDGGYGVLFFFLEW